MPAPVNASLTCAVAGFGVPVASFANVSVTVRLTLSVAAVPAADVAPPDVLAIASPAGVLPSRAAPDGCAGAAAVGVKDPSLPPTKGLFAAGPAAHPAKSAARAAHVSAAPARYICRR